MKISFIIKILYLTVSLSNFNLRQELISAINIVKMYCWESAFLKKIIKFRKLEIDQIRRRNTVAFITQRFLMASGKFIGIFTFLYYFSVTSVRDFRSSDIFVVQSFVEDLNWNLGVLFWAVFSFSEVLVEDCSLHYLRVRVGTEVRFSVPSRARLLNHLILKTLTDTGEDSKLVHRRKRPNVDTLFSSLFFRRVRATSMTQR